MLFGRSPPAWVVAIAGQEFGEVKEGLSTTALGNLAVAVAAIVGWIGEQTAPGNGVGVDCRCVTVAI